MINVFDRDRGVIAVQLIEGGPFSEMRESDLVKTIGIDDSENETAHWVECRLPGGDRVIHRSAHVVLKQGPNPLVSIAGDIGRG